MNDRSSFKAAPIAQIASRLGLKETDWVPYGTAKAKIRLEVLKKHPPRGKLILVSAITPPRRAKAKPPRPSDWDRPSRIWDNPPPSPCVNRPWGPAWE